MSSGSMVQDGLEKTAQDLSSEAPSAEVFVILWIEYLREVTYTDYDEPKPDLGCNRTVHRAFGRPERFSEDELRDAVHDLNSRGKIEMHRYPVRGTQVSGSHGKKYPQKYRVTVTR